MASAKSKQPALFSAKPYKPRLWDVYNSKGWSALDADQRTEVVERFEEKVYETYGCFPKANWMR